MAHETTKSVTEKDFLLRLANSQNYREFINTHISYNKGVWAKPNLSALSRKAGFSSRSYMSLVMKGERGLSTDAYLKITKALGLKEPAKSLFKIMVAREHGALFKKMPAKSIETLREELINQNANHQIHQNSKIKNSIGGRNTFLVYAALGSVEIGESIENIIAKTGLSRNQINFELDAMIELGLVIKCDADIFKAISSNIVFDNLTANNSFARAVTQTTKAIVENLQNDMNSKKTLTHYSVFSINKSDKVAYRNELRDAILEITNKYQDDLGDQIEEVIVFASNPSQ